MIIHKIIIVAIITIICILLYLNKNAVINAPIELYKKSDSYIQKLKKLTSEDKNKVEDIYKNEMNLQNLDKDFPVLFTTVNCTVTGSVSTFSTFLTSFLHPTNRNIDTKNNKIVFFIFLVFNYLFF